MIAAILLTLSSIAWSAGDWIREQSTYKNSLGSRTFVVDTSRAGVVTTLAWKGRNILGFESGSFRPATQAMWNNGTGWPPPPQWVDLPFRPTLLSGASVLQVEGQVDARKLQPVRRLRFDASDSSLVNEYVVRNTATDSARHIAAWEIVRLPAKALQFFPKGQELTGPANTLVPNQEDSMVWVKDDGTQNQKLLYRDNKEGWMAAVVDSILLVKTWKDVPLSQIPPGQGEVQIYLQQNTAFGEMECMGPWTTLAPRDSLVWTVRWYLASLPSNLSKTVGNPELIKLARKLMSSTTVSTRKGDRVSPSKWRPSFDATGRLIRFPAKPGQFDPRNWFAAP